jgi:uncharacterized protein involved in exopolysaccharide biosynthesis
MKNGFETQQEFTLLNLFKLVKYHKKFFISFVAISLIIVGLYSYIMPQEFHSVGTILPQQQSDRSSGLSTFLQSMSGAGNLLIGSTGQTSQLQVFAEILRSRTVASYIVDSLDLMKYPNFKGLSKNELSQLIKSMLDITVERSGIIIVTAAISTPYFPKQENIESAKALASKIANTAISGLDYVIRQKSITTAKKTRLYIENELEKYDKRLDSLENILEEFQSKNKVLLLEEQTNAILSQSVSAGTELSKAQIDLSIAEQEYEPNSPTIKSYRKIVDFLKNQYGKIQQGGLTTNDEFSIPLSKIPKLYRDYIDLSRDRKIIEQVILYLETQRHQEAIQEQRDIPLVEPLDLALKPETRYAPNRKLMILVGLVISTFFAIALISIYGMIKGQIYLKKVE